MCGRERKGESVDREGCRVGKEGESKEEGRQGRARREGRRWIKGEREGKEEDG